MVPAARLAESLLSHLPCGQPAVPTEPGRESSSGLLAPHLGKEAGKKGRKDKRRPGEKEKRRHRERKERVSLRVSSCWEERHKGTSYQGLECGSGGGPVGEGARPGERQGAGTLLPAQRWREGTLLRGGCSTAPACVLALGLCSLLVSPWAPGHPWLSWPPT